MQEDTKQVAIVTSGDMIVDIFAFNHDLLKVATKDVPNLEPNHAAFCVKAIREEARELEQLFEDANSEEHPAAASWRTAHAVDACIDAAYFAIGGLARAGLTVEQAIACFKAVDSANKTKKLGVVAQRGDMGVPDATKPADFVPPEKQIHSILFGTE